MSYAAYDARDSSKAAKLQAADIDRQPPVRSSGSCRSARDRAQQQTRRTLLLPQIVGTNGRTDGRMDS